MDCCFLWVYRISLFIYLKWQWLGCVSGYLIGIAGLQYKSGWHLRAQKRNDFMHTAKETTILPPEQDCEAAGA